MKRNVFYILTIMMVFSLSSCEKDPENLKFSELTEEENKQLVENSALEAAKAMNELKDEPVVETSVAMVSFLEMADPMSAASNRKSKITSTVEMIAGLDDGSTGLNDIYTVMSDPGELAEDPETVEDLWDELVGTYSWNASAEDWDFATNADAIVFEFPSTENGTSNNASLTVSNFTSVVVNLELIDEEDYEGGIPTSLNVDFLVDGDEIMTMSYAGEFRTADAVPTSLAADITIGNFVLAADGTNNDKEVSASHSFKNGNSVIYDMTGAVKGDFSQENIDASTETMTDTWTYTDYIWNDATQMYEEVEVTEVDEWEEVNLGAVAHTGNFKIQLFDISLSGSGDITSLWDEVELIYPEDYWDDESFDDKAAAEAEAAAMNEYLNMQVVDEAGNRKIAAVEAYVVEDNYYDNYVDYWVDFRMVYGDESFVDLETYFEDGFDDVVAEFNSMIGELNSKYDWDIEPIEY